MEVLPLKSKFIRYAEAIERNLKGAMHRRAKYHGLTLEEAKTKLGIKRNDDRHDTAVLDLISLP